MTIDSRPGAGTAVHVYLPASSPVVPVDQRGLGAAIMGAGRSS